MTFRLISTVSAAVALAVVTIGAAAAQDDRIFTVAKYPVDATGTNAVTAKREAIAEGGRAAFRSLLKRLVPISSYSAIEQLKKLDPERFIGSMRVRSEENSSTQYIASLDFSFQPDQVRGLLNQHGVPYVDRAAEPTSLLLLYQPAAQGGTSAMSDRAGAASWRSVWSDLDLENSLAPLTLVAQNSELAPDDRRALLAADAQAIATTAANYRTAQLVVAEAQPLPGSDELQITLAGQDAVGRFAVSTRYRLDPDFTYSLELAAVIAQGVLESRWKSQVTGNTGAGAFAGGATMALELVAEFSDLGQWQRQQQVLAGIPGVRNLEVSGLSGRSANISLAYPGGGEALQAALSPRGLALENINGFWVLR